MEKKKLQNLFKMHPEIKKVCIDSQGKAWINEETAKNQSKNGDFKTVKRSEVYGLQKNAKN